ncbi:MAG: baaA1 [Candidatus Parcubacteria bacterium]|nr:baaA1 [Candidatus Parcubacteria bacterium]
MKKYLIAIAAVLVVSVSYAHAQNYSYSRDLYIGSSGPDVAALQNWLLSNGYDIPALRAGITPQGYFGFQTQAALARYQASVGLPPNGYFGALTRARMNGSVGGYPGTPTPVPVPTAFIRVMSPNGGETLQRGTSYMITWTSTGLSQQWPGTGTIELQPALPACAEPTQPIRCMIMVRAPYPIAQNVNLASQSYSWSVPDVLSLGDQPLGNQPIQAAPDGSYKIKICQTSTNICDTSDAYFTVTSSSVGGTTGGAGPLAIVSPNGGESWQKGSIQTIRWTSPYYFQAAYGDIRLVRYMPPCSGICPMYMVAPYTIASNISINQNSYAWTVGDAAQQGSTNGQRITVPDGQYTVQICQTGSGSCVSSTGPFTICGDTTVNPGGQSPVISGVTAPTSLSIGQTSTWTVRAYDPLNGSLTYSVDWGDQPQNNPYYLSAASSPQFAQTSSFTHSYANPGTYQITFTVRNASGMTAQAKTTVNVGGVNCPPGYMCATRSPYMTPYI